MLIMRAQAALALASAIVALPIVLDQCAVRCEAHRGAAAVAAPACHHAPPARPGFSPSRASCGHDHDGFVAISTAAAPTAHRVFTLASEMAVSATRAVEPVVGARMIAPPGSPPEKLPSQDQSVSLRL